MDKAVAAIPTKPFCAGWLNTLRRALGTVAGKPALMSGYSISPSQARMIENQLSILHRQLTAEPDRSLAAAEIGRLVAAFPAQDASVSGALRADAYMGAVSRYPTWAIAAACEAVFAGKSAFGRPWGPGPVELADLVRKIIQPFAEELRDLETLAAVGGFTEPSPAERERVKEGFEKLRVDLAAGQTTYGPRSAHQIYEDAMGFEKPA